ncbi:unnamed protein product, partial [Schistosoma spindalis]
TRMMFISSCCLLTALILSPLFHYIWLRLGTGNANFYFAASLVHVLGQVTEKTNWIISNLTDQLILTNIMFF